MNSRQAIQQRHSCLKDEREAGRLTGIPALVEFLDGALGLVLPVEPCINVADQVVSDIVAHVHLEQVAILDQFAVCVLV